MEEKTVFDSEETNTQKNPNMNLKTQNLHEFNRKA